MVGEMEWKEWLGLCSCQLRMQKQNHLLLIYYYSEGNT